ncbi:hypothetical protein BHAP_0177 [Bifidobacterium hapali]|uniref:Sortase B cell surface sorting signal n=2 Tax=Bifidobacterium hapali TaxID=1630172 RepID=A0A261G542_9BIFI|nr:hypothetical protein BHAP_0177 [Bifidobacterium hapali]
MSARLTSADRLDLVLEGKYDAVSVRTQMPLHRLRSLATLLIQRNWLCWLSSRTPSTLRQALQARFVPYTLMLLVAWAPYLTLIWPGALRDDTLAQYLQTAGLHRYYTQHPLFDTLIFGLFWKLGDAAGSPLIGEAIYTTVQVMLLAAGCSLILCYIRKLGVPRWLRVIGLIYLATSYVVVGAVGTMGKDSLHTVFFLPAAVLFVETCLTRGRVLARQPVAVAFVVVLFATIASKRTALVIVICAGVCLLIACDRGRRRRHAACCLVLAIVFAQVIFAPIAAAATHANHSPSREIWGIVTQSVTQVARDYPSAISQDQRAALDAIMNLDRATLEMKPYRSNETFQTLRTDPSPSASERFAALRVWVQLGLAYPGEYFKAWSGPIRGWWDPHVNFAYPTDSDYLLRGGYLRQWATFLPEDAGILHDGIATRNADDIADADTRAALRVTQITHDLAPLMGTSRKAQWQRDMLEHVRHWVRDNNPLTAMALYVTWIPLLTGVILLIQTIMERRRLHRDTSGVSAYPSGRCAAFSLLVFTMLSLYASPEALFWYPIPVFCSLPLFTALPLCTRS